MATTVTQKGQVTIPKPVRDYLGIGPGSRVQFVVGADGKVRVMREDEPSPRLESADATHLARWRGVLKDGISTDEFMRLMRGDDDV